MQRPALILMLIVSLLLPSFGSMAVAMDMPAEPCSMQGENPHAQPVAESPCCEDMEQGSSSQSHCKSGHECKTGSVLHVALSKPLHPLSSPPHTLLAEAPLQRAPVPLWRPPRVC
jgi:hypothetical protein